MATPKRSPLEESPLVGAVEDITDAAARAAGHVATKEDLAQLAAERDEKIALIVREHQVPKPIAIIMADTGYSKGTANRIYNDAAKRERAKREAAHAGRQAAPAKQTQTSAA